MRSVSAAISLGLTGFFAGQSGAMAAEVISVDKVTTIDAPIADCRQSDEGVCFSTGDFKGSYQFRPEPDGETVTMDADAFAAYVTKRMSNMTRREVPQLQDWVVRYSSADGHVWLWRAGRPVATGQWKLVRRPLHAQGKAFESVLLCYSAPALAGFPMKKPSVDGWDCYPASWSVSYPEYNRQMGYESRNGDVFHLSSGHIPYKLTPNTRPDWPVEVKQ